MMASPTMNSTILVINSGSSSVKFALYETAQSQALTQLWSGAIERIGLSDGRFHATDANGAVAVDRTADIADHRAALSLLLDAIEQRAPARPVAAVGHRVVHGGPDCDCPLVVTAAVEERLRQLIPLAPLHQPNSLAGITAVRNARPDLLQVACFDTAFHQNMPRMAKLTGLPRELYDEGIRRYGFHGLSYEYIHNALRNDGVDVDNECIVVAHLGNGASMCALKGGHSVDTTMGFSTLAGLPMGTRCGDLDPGIVLHLMVEKGLSIDRMQQLLYDESGMLGVSGLSRNMQDLLARPSQVSAVEAVDYFAYQARRQLAALTAALGGLDRVVFTGGIGANSEVIRSKICTGLEYLGITIDHNRNGAGNRLISTDNSRVFVEAFATNEELTIAEHVQKTLQSRPVSQETKS